MLKIQITDFDSLNKVVGHLDENLNHIQELTTTEIFVREGCLCIQGEEDDLAHRVLSVLMALAKQSDDLDINDVDYIVSLGREHREEEVLHLRQHPIAITADGRPIYPKTVGQKRYIDTIRAKDIVFGTGPAGTGKTYLAVALAAYCLREKQFERIILTRPAVEAGESLGFLPGDLKEKVDPYLRPIYDVLFELLGTERYERYMERGIIEIAPLAYMRGRTLDRSFIVLDEAQNTTPEQMKMFLTRLGYSSKMVITGDVTQTDLGKNQISGLLHARRVLQHTKGIGFVDLQKVDIVRHPLVRRVIEAYEHEVKS